MGRKESDLLSDSAIDREIREALAVNPSPEFLARVRTRIANEPLRVRFPYVRLVGAVALSAFVTLAVGLSTSRRDNPTPSEPMTTEIPRPGTDITLDPASAANAALDERGGHGSTKSRPHMTKPESPVVLVSPDEMIAFRQLMAAVAERKFEVSLLVPAPMPHRDASIAITIPPINIEPLSTNDEGVQQ
jgi:hypothetical protein